MNFSSVENVNVTDKGCEVLIKTKKGDETIHADVVLSAVGITANIENIGLEDVGIKTENGKLVVDEFYNTNVPGYMQLVTFYQHRLLLMLLLPRELFV